MLCVFILGCSSNTPSSTTIKSAEPTLLIDNQLLMSHFEFISSDAAQGRKAGSYGSSYVQQYLVNQLENYNIKCFQERCLHKFIINNLLTENKEGHNIVGELKSDDENSEYIVLTAHYDHLGHSGNKIYNGADDNASGTAALLSIAAYLSTKPLNHHILIIFTDAEEQNLKGSRAFLQQHPELKNKIKLNINMDMLAGNKHSNRLHYLTKKLDNILTNNELAMFLANQSYANFKVVKGFKRAKNDLNKKIDWLKASDHNAFYQEGIPIIYYGVGTHNNYHTVNDTFKNTNHQLLINSANTILSQIILLDRLI